MSFDLVQFIIVIGDFKVLTFGRFSDMQAWLLCESSLDLNFPPFSEHLCSRGFVEFYVMKVAPDFFTFVTAYGSLSKAVLCFIQ